MIFVDKVSRESRRKTNELINEWLEEQDKLGAEPQHQRRHLGVMPEGWYENGKVLLPFKLCAFRPGRPVPRGPTGAQPGCRPPWPPARRP